MKMFIPRRAGMLMAAVATVGFSTTAFADSINPTSYTNDSLAVGDSVTIRKTVTVTSEPPTTAPLDVMFLFDTTGSMGAEIASAKSSATSILTDLSTIGSLRSGVAFYDDVTASSGGDGTVPVAGTDFGILSNLSATDSDTTSAINTLSASGGGDGPEEGNAGALDVANNASWRAGSNRFLIMLGDSEFKTPPDVASTLAALSANNVELLGINFGGIGFNNAITDLGGTVYDSSAGSLASDIADAIDTAFSTYSTVSVDDLDGGNPLIDVSAICVTADTGVCAGNAASGSFDRSADRDFGFDVTFTRLAAGTASFDTFGLVDGGIIAAERDLFSDVSIPAVPLPAGLPLLAGALAAFGVLRRRKAA